MHAHVHTHTGTQMRAYTQRLNFSNSFGKHLRHKRFLLVDQYYVKNYIMKIPILIVPVESLYFYSHK